MRRIFTILTIIAIASGCNKESGNTDSPKEEAPIILSLENNEIKLICGESQQVKISGVSSYCTAKAEDEFVAYSSGGEGYIEIEGSHIGETIVVVSNDEAENKDSCKVTVVPTIDCVGDITSLWGSSLEEVYDKTDRTNMSKSYYNEQRGCQTFSYKIGDYYIVTMYYFSDDKLCGIHKTVDAANDTEIQAYINISNSLAEYMEFVSGSATSGRIYKHPSGYYAVLYSPSLNETFDIYYATTLEEAQSHKFTR